MQRLQRIAILLSLLEGLREYGSWCGETHVQKATYLLESMLGVDLGHNFILYKYGPYSFDLSDELDRLRSNSFIKAVPFPPYGASLFPGDNWEEYKTKFPKTLGKYKSRIDFIASKLGGMKVTELERLSTAFYVTQTNPAYSSLQKAEEIRKVKPHIKLPDAKTAISQIDEMIDEAKSLSEAA